jgi:DNA-binding NtrC family response regulator
MSERLFALLVHDQTEPFDSLKRTLRDLHIETYSVSTCRDAEDVISQCQPHIIFTESALRDGSWVSILNIADAAKVPLNVIVVSAHPDTRFYVSAMERGAFDFVAPPFERESLAFVTRSAALDAQRRRGALVQATHA